MEETPRLDLAIKDIASSSREDKSYHPRVSNAGQCPRMLTYDAMGLSGEPMSADTIVLLEDGNVHEDVSCNWLDKTDYKVTDRQLGVDVGEIKGSPDPSWFCDYCLRDIPNNILHGHIDGIVSGQYLFEHKGLNDRGMLRLDKEYPEGYVRQCSSYCRGLRNSGYDIRGAILLCKNKNNSQYKQINVEYNYDEDEAWIENAWNGRGWYLKDAVQGVLDMHGVVEEYKDGLELPARPYDFDDWHCNFCRHNEACWKSLPDEIKNSKVPGTMLNEGDILYEDIRRYANLKKTESELSANVKKLRSIILMELSSRKIAQGLVGDILFDVRTGERYGKVYRQLHTKEVR